MENLYSWSKNGMKMIVNTGYKTFDKQVSSLSVGNVISATQYSNYIRTYNETNCNGNIFNKGHLRDYDLQYFDKNSMTSGFKSWLNKITEDKKIILYEYFIYRNAKKETLGWLVEDVEAREIIGTQHNIYSNVRAYNITKVLEFCKKFIESKENKKLV